MTTGVEVGGVDFGADVVWPVFVCEGEGVVGATVGVTGTDVVWAGTTGVTIAKDWEPPIFCHTA